MNRDEQDAQRTERSLSGREIMRSLQEGTRVGWNIFGPNKMQQKDIIMARAFESKSISKQDLDQAAKLVVDTDNKSDFFKYARAALAAQLKDAGVDVAK